MKDERMMWVVSRNSDLTEGRGRQLVHAVCELESTAIRLARGCDVQGADGGIERLPVFKGLGGRTYGPVSLAVVSKEDIAEEKRRGEARARHEKRDEALKRAKAAGLSDDDLALLQGDK